MTIFQCIEKYGKTGAALLEMCRSHETVRQLIPDGLELLLPRFRMEIVELITSGEPTKIYERTMECWWRSAETGALRYYVVLDLPAAMIQEFRELPGDVIIPETQFTDKEMSYLDQAASLWNPIPISDEKVDALDSLWQSLVPDSLRDYALQVKEEQTISSYLLPIESLTCWNWEMLRDLLLQRENTTVERIRDYVEYQKSGSDKLYIAPEDREEAKKRGMKFVGPTIIYSYLESVGVIDNHQECCFKY